MLKHSRLLCVALLSLTSLCRAQAPDAAQMKNWGRWRGPMLDGSSPVANPPTEWSATKNVKWKVAVPGKGSASPIVWENKIFILSAVPQGAEGASTPHEFTVFCFDRTKGDLLWKHVAVTDTPHEDGHPTNTFASGSPVTDGKFLYVSFGSYGIFKYDLDGKQIWKKDLGDMKTRNAFGEGASPTLVGDRLIVMWDHEAGSKIFCLSTADGSILWEKPRDEITTWATATVVEFDGRQQVLTNGKNRVRSYDLLTGEVIWECGGQVSNPIPSPVVQNNIAIVMTGYQGNAVYAVPLSAKGDVTDTSGIAWSRKDAGPYISSPVLYEGQLYWTKERQAVLYVANAVTGEKLVDGQRMNGLGTLYSSLVAAAGKVYVSDRDGKTQVLKHGPKYEVMSTNDVGEPIDASLALVDNQIFLRGAAHLFCIQEQQPAP